MGVHHFKLRMLPRRYFDDLGLLRPSVLSREEIERGGSEDAGWWSSLQPSEQAVTRLRQLCPQDTSWGETEEFETGGTWGSDLRIWKDNGRVWSVDFRFAPIADDRKLLDQFVAIARDEQCLLLESESGSLFEPIDELVIERLRSSRAMRFVQDPQGAIIEAAREISQ